MCNFLSAIVLKSGEVFCRPDLTDAHERLIEARGLSDNGRGGFVRVEFVPQTSDAADPRSYCLRLDEPTRPEWFDGAMAGRTAETLRERVRAMLVQGHREVLLGGSWILCPGARVRATSRARIICMSGDARIELLRDGSSVGRMLDRSMIGQAVDHARIAEAGYEAEIMGLGDSSFVGSLLSQARIGHMAGMSQVCVMRASSVIGEMTDRARVSRMTGHSKVLAMLDQATIGEIEDKAVAPRCSLAELQAAMEETGVGG